MPRARALIAASVIAGLVLVAWAGGLFSGGEDPGIDLPLSGDDVAGGGRPATESSMRGAEGIARDRPPVPDGVGGGLDAAAQETLDASLGALRVALTGEGEDQGVNAPEARRAALAELRRLAQRVDGAWALLARLERETDEQTALRLGRVLRNAKHEEIADALVTRATTGPSPLTRRAAVVALELRPPAVWFEPVQDAYLTDRDARVRGEAAQVLARSLQDRAQAAVHTQVRDTLARGLESPDVEQRLRTLTAMMVDPSPRPEAIEAVRARLQDGDPRVQREARAVLRILEGRVRR